MRMWSTGSWICISIHALRVEGDHNARVGLPLKNAFLSTPSGWRATNERIKYLKKNIISIHALRVEGDGRSVSPGRFLLNFYPRPPGGGRRFLLCHAQRLYEISIHALRVEGDRSTR